jgi:hypothetical protein
MSIPNKLLPVKIIMVFFALLSVLFVCPLIQAQNKASQSVAPVANAPKMVVGEQWVLKTHRGLLSYKVIDVKADGSFTFEIKNNAGMVLCNRHYNKDYKILGTDFTTLGKKTKLGAPWEKALNFPLSVGKTWRDEIRGPGADNIKRTFMNIWKVEKIEMVETPFGKFSAFRIHRNFSASGMERGRDQYFWYSPEMKIVIKMSHPTIYGVHEAFIQNDLVSHQPAASQ